MILFICRRNAKRKLISLIFGMLLLSSPIAGDDRASPKPSEDRQIQLDTYKNRQKNLRIEIERGKQEVEMFRRQESDIVERLNRVDMALNISRGRAAALEKEITMLDAKIADAAKVSQDLRNRIEVNQKYVAQRLVAMYKMNWLGKFHLLASAETMHEFMQRKIALEHILAHDDKIRRELMRNQIELEKILSSLETHHSQKKTRAIEYRRQIKIMTRERKTRRRLLADIRSQKALELAAIKALTQAANELNSKIKSLKSDGKAFGSAENISRLPFSAHKGLLIRPVKGRITTLFGPYKNRKYNVINFRSGIDIKADKGEPVRSVFKGKVLYSNWFKGYGNMIIIDHGKSYYTVYAHLEETFKSKGDIVETREVIATVGDTGSMDGAKLYFEVRHHGKPANPLLWLRKEEPYKKG